MQSKPRHLTILIVLLLVLAIGIHHAYSAALCQRDSNILRTAFLNGYVTAVRTDIERLKTYQKDKKLLQQAAEMAAEDYMALLAQINK